MPRYTLRNSVRVYWNCRRFHARLRHDWQGGGVWNWIKMKRERKYRERIMAMESE